MVEHSAYLEFRIPSGLDDEFNSYKNTAKLDYLPRKQKPPRSVRNHEIKSENTSTIDLSESTRPRLGGGNSHVFIFNRNIETPVNVSKFAYANKLNSNKSSAKLYSRQQNKSRQEKQGGMLPSGEYFVGKEGGGGDLVPYKFVSRPVLKAYPGKDPGNLKVTTNSRSATTMSSSDFFELAPKDQPIELDLSADQTQQSIYQNPRSSRIGMASSYPQGPNSFNSANVLPAENSSRVSYPLSRHSYTTPQPPFVNRFKIRKEKEPVTQIMTQPTPGHDYNLSPIPPSNSAVPPHENENDTQEGYGKEFASANVASHLE